MIARKLKKNSVALDDVNFGEEDEGKSKKLEALVAAVNNNDSSHIMHVSPGSIALLDVLIRQWMAVVLQAKDAMEWAYGGESAVKSIWFLLILENLRLCMFSSPLFYPCLLLNQSFLVFISSYHVKFKPLS